jgi:hypothetical protein
VVEDNWLRAINGWMPCSTRDLWLAWALVFLSSAIRTERAARIHLLLPRPPMRVGAAAMMTAVFPCAGWLGVRAGRVIPVRGGYDGSSTVLVLDWSLAYRAATVWTCYHFPVFRTPATTSSRGAQSHSGRMGPAHCGR